MAIAKKTHDFLIAGVPYKLKTAHDDETVRELVAFVNQKMNQALAASKNGSFQNAAVVSALNIAEELILLKRRVSKELDTIEDKAQRIAIELEQSRSYKADVSN